MPRDPGNIIPTGKRIRDMIDQSEDVANELNSNERRRRDTFTIDVYSQDKQKVDEIVTSVNF